MTAPAAVAPRKQRIEDLAVLGGPPAFTEALHVGRPNVGDRARLMARLEDALERRWLSNDGPYVQEIERRLADMLEVPHCVAVCNGTVGLDLLGRAFGLTGEVILPSFAFVAAAHALVWQGLTPVFADVDPATHNLDPAAAEREVTPRTTAILGVHLWGRPCDVEGLSAIARVRGLRLFFDAAHALGCTHGGKPVGGFGDAEVFSFHATKVVNAFEGGAITTNDEKLAGRLRLMRNFGFADYDTVVSLGTNAKMSEASAAMGLTSLESIDAFAASNRRNHQAYAHALEGLPGVTLMPYDEAERSNRHYVVLEIDAARAGLTRDQLRDVLHAENVLARRYFHPGIHAMEPYRTRFPDAAGRLPHTRRLAETVLCLPTGTAVRTDQLEAVACIIRLAVENAGELGGRLRGRPAAS